MASDFTVIQAVRQQFGDRASTFGMDVDAPFVGLSKEFPFSCPLVDTKELAVLHFESIGARSGLVNLNGWSVDHHKRNIIRINGVNIAGGITPGPFMGSGRDDSIWKSHTLIVPAGILRKDNTLYIESISSAFYAQYHDEFILDNIVIVYKTGGAISASRAKRAK